jgi:hypothetical protein
VVRGVHAEERDRRAAADQPAHRRIVPGRVMPERDAQDGDRLEGVRRIGVDDVALPSGPSAPR